MLPCVLHHLYHTTPKSESSVVVVLMLLFTVFLFETFPSSSYLLGFGAGAEAYEDKQLTCYLWGRNCDFSLKKDFQYRLRSYLGSVLTTKVRYIICKSEVYIIQT